MYQAYRCRFRALRPIGNRGKFARPIRVQRTPELSLTRALWQQNVAQRHFSLSTVLLPPAVFSGLLITLWAYKCFMMILFQNKIIYQPSMPPFSRSEKVASYINACRPISWEEHAIRSIDGTKLKVLEGGIAKQEHKADRPHVVVVYFQGNGSSLPPRLPYLSNIMKQLQSQSKSRYTFVALSYRGFWTSSGRANQRGIELDAQAALEWVADRYAGSMNTRIVIYGQSIGAGVATIATANWLAGGRHTTSHKPLQISGLLLETPFTSLREMLIGLYPQKFLPYRYLGPFLMSTWDSRAALKSINETLHNISKNRSVPGGTPEGVKVLLLEAGDDELVPEGNAALLMQVCRESEHIQAEHRIVSRALHTNVMMQANGRGEIVQFLRSFENKDQL